MKKIYWRPSKVPRVILVVIAIVAIAGMLSVELIRTSKKQPHYKEKIQAARAMKDGMEVIKRHHTRIIGPIDENVDPANSGMIGLSTSPITSTIGHLPAKQTTVNPNWGAVIVDLLKKAGVKEGDVVAMGLSGSFPAINLAALVAADVLKLKVIAITSVSASNWGANIPNFTWLDMERVLLTAGVISHRSVAASLGGEEDLGLVKSKKGRELLHAAIKRNGVRFIEHSGLKESINARMTVYNEISDGNPIAAYINVGGGTVSVGGARVGKMLYEPGLNRRASLAALRIDSVMTRFARQGVPLIHMTQVNKLAEDHGLPRSPTTIPAIGEGPVYISVQYNLYLAAANLLILIFILYAFLKLDIGYRIFGSSRITETPKHPEPMV